MHRRPSRHRVVVVVGGGLVVVVVLGTVVVVVGGRRAEGGVVVVGAAGFVVVDAAAVPGVSTSDTVAGGARPTMGCPGGRRDRSAGHARGRGRRRAGGGREPWRRRSSARRTGRAHVVHASAPAAVAWSLRARTATSTASRRPTTASPANMPARWERGRSHRARRRTPGDQRPRVAVRRRRAAFARVGPGPVLVHVDPFLVRRQRRWFPPEETAWARKLASGSAPRQRAGAARPLTGRGREARP